MKYSFENEAYINIKVSFYYEFYDEIVSDSYQQ